MPCRNGISIGSAIFVHSIGLQSAQQTKEHAKLMWKKATLQTGMTKYRKGPQETTKDCKVTLWARLQEIGTNWNQWCLIFQCAPRFFKTRSFTSVFILCLLSTHYSLICIVRIFDLRNKNNCYVISIIVTTTYRPMELSIVKLRPTDVPEPTRYGKVSLLESNWVVVIDQGPTAWWRKTKTAKHRITQTTPHDSPGTLVFWCQRSPRNSTGVIPYEGAKCR